MAKKKQRGKRGKRKPPKQRNHVALLLAKRNVKAGPHKDKKKHKSKTICRAKVVDE